MQKLYLSGKRFLIALLFLTGFLSQPGYARQKPNIVIFIADDLNQQDIGCYGNTDVKTPNMDALASEGMLFNRAFAASSMCSPSRSVMFTGLYPFRNGTQMNHFTVRPNTSNLPQFLKEQGYRVVISGKTHVSPLENFPFEYIGKEFGAYSPIANRVDRKKETVQFIEDHFATRSEQPLCILVAPWIPHVPWFPNRDFDPEKLKLPDYLADTKETRNALAAYYQSIGEADKMFGEILAAVDRAGQKNNTAVMLTSDQGAQFPSAKWTVYDQGLRVPFIVRWPGKVAKGSVSDALISLVDLTPTLVDIGGGKPNKNLDGKSFKEVLTGRKKEHHDLVFGETTVEPHYWYNYTPSRTVFTSDGFHYIKNYHPGVRFITHIDAVERNEFYFDSWVEKALTDPKAKFLLDRYSYRPPEELYNLKNDRQEFKNLVSDPAHFATLKKMRTLLNKELDRQGETEQAILDGPLPKFSDKNYTIRPYGSAAEMSFNKKLWEPEKLIITAYLEGIDKGGILTEYFNNFKLYAYEGKIGLAFSDGTKLESPLLPKTYGHLIFTLDNKGDLNLSFNNSLVLKAKLKGDFTKINGGYVTNGIVQGKELTDQFQPFKGKITDLTFSMNELSRTPERN